MAQGKYDKCEVKANMLYWLPIENRTLTYLLLYRLINNVSLLFYVLQMFESHIKLVCNRNN